MARNKYLPALEGDELCPEFNVQASGPETPAPCSAETVGQQHFLSWLVPAGFLFIYFI